MSACLPASKPVCSFPTSVLIRSFDSSDLAVRHCRCGADNERKPLVQALFSERSSSASSASSSPAAAPREGDSLSDSDDSQSLSVSATLRSSRSDSPSFDDDDSQETIEHPPTTQQQQPHQPQLNVRQQDTTTAWHTTSAAAVAAAVGDSPRIAKRKAEDDEQEVDEHASRRRRPRMPLPPCGSSLPPGALPISGAGYVVSAAGRSALPACVSPALAPRAYN